MKHALSYLTLALIFCGCAIQPETLPDETFQESTEKEKPQKELSQVVENDPEKVFHANIEKAKTTYRRALVERFADADRVELCVVRHDEFKKGTASLPYEDKWIRISPQPTNSLVRIIKSRLLEKNERQEFLSVFGEQLVKEETGKPTGSFQSPFHGVRVYKGDNLLYEGAFSWISRNFTFNYPFGSGFPLHPAFHATSPELKTLCNRLLPPPHDEVERIKKQNPGFLVGFFPFPEAPPLKPDYMEVRVGGITFGAPKAYKHVEMEGEDSIVGKFLIPKPELEVSYDIGMLAGTPKKLDELSPEARSALVYSERVFYEGDWDGVEKYYILCFPRGNGYRMTMVFPLYYAFFSTEFEDYNNITFVKNALKEISIRHHRKK